MQDATGKESGQSVAAAGIAIVAGANSETVSSAECSPARTLVTALGQNTRPEMLAPGWNSGGSLAGVLTPAKGEIYGLCVTWTSPNSCVRELDWVKPRYLEPTSPEASDKARSRSELPLHSSAPLQSSR